MDDFVGRAKELRLLAEVFDSAHSAFVPIYGRRRVGKSELILKFMAGRRGVYYVGKQSPPELQVREFLRQASKALDIPLLAELRIDDWARALATVVEQSITAQPRSKLILALDEFQWIAASDPRIVTALQQCWDRDWKSSGAVVLLLCGSYVGFMEREVLGRSSPLFGRRTAQIHLQPFDYREAALFHPRWSPVDQAKAYFLVGGLPQYLLCLDDGRSIDANIRANLLDEFAPLFHEPTFLLREEVREVAPYHAVLFAIASGSHNARDVATATGLPERNLHYYFDQLEGLGYVRRRHPLDGGPRNPKQVRLSIGDPLLRFYFRFVFPNTSALKSAGVTRTFADVIKPSLDSWYGEGFERLCRELCPSSTPGNVSTRRSRSASSGARRRRSTSSAFVATTGLTSASASGDRFGLQPASKWNSPGRSVAIATLGALRSTSGTSPATSHLRGRTPRAGTRSRICTR